MLTVHRVTLALCAGALAAAAMPSRRADDPSKLSCFMVHQAQTLGLLAFGTDESHLTGIASDVTITDRFGDEAPVLVSDEGMTAQKFDFWTCDSNYHGDGVTSATGFRGQFRPSHEDGTRSEYCLTAATSDLTNYNQSVTLSKNCDSNDDNVIYNFWFIDSFRETYTARLIGRNDLPGSWSLEQTGQSGNHTLVQLIYSSDDDRRKRDAGDGMPYWLTLSSSRVCPS